LEIGDKIDANYFTEPFLLARILKVLPENSQLKLKCTSQ
jgi:hypothetical protein